MKFSIKENQVKLIFSFNSIIFFILLIYVFDNLSLCFAVINLYFIFVAIFNDYSNLLDSQALSKKVSALNIE